MGRNVTILSETGVIQQMEALREIQAADLLGEQKHKRVILNQGSPRL